MADETKPADPQRRHSHVTITMDHLSGDIELKFETRHLDEAMNMLHTAMRHVEMKWRTAQVAVMQAEAQANARVAGILTRMKQ